jgi:hypothetical protein
MQTVRRLVRASVLLSLLAPALPAQVPPGWYVVAAYREPAIPGTGGLYLLHPRNGQIVPVTGLPADLTGIAGGYGTQWVALRPSDGVLLATGDLGYGTQQNLHILSLNGNQMATDVSYPLGVIQASSQVGSPQGAFLPDGDILVAADALGNPGEPLAGSILGRVRPSLGPPGTPGTVVAVAVPNPHPNGFINALSIDPTGATAYLGIVHSTVAPTSSTIYRVPVSGGMPVAIVTFSGGIHYLATDQGGQLVAAMNTTPPSLFRINPVSGAVTTINTPVANLNGAAVESVTGGFAILGAPHSAYWVTPAGGSTLLVSRATAGWSVPCGIDVNPDPVGTGGGTPGVATYTWALAPNPGGLPTVGNASFSVTVQASSGAAAGLFGLSFAPAAIPVGGITVLIDPALLLLLLPAAPGVPIPLGIPAVPMLAGLPLYGQTVHTEPGGLAASDGLTVTIL